jgi:hypothetical protein
MRCSAVGVLHMGAYSPANTIVLSSGATLLPAFTDFPVRAAADTAKPAPQKLEATMYLSVLCAVIRAVL